ncbi:TraR/DksA family transcriptional regulator [Endozoicomonas sp. Mp262]|uniref:TraR/DksA family transcriptional regulator n=1 Tax=Endozoicomonas sp. Mp262 TaxID=2919499 RepID=UPI0021DAB2E0
MVNHEQLKALLLSRREELTDRLGKIKQGMTRKSSADWSEQAQERENDEVIDALGNEATIELNQINKALDRITEGEYGYCSVCGDEIADGRLMAMPYTDLCIRCAEARDQ